MKIEDIIVLIGGCFIIAFLITLVAIAGVWAASVAIPVFLGKLLIIEVVAIVIIGILSWGD